MQNASVCMFVCLCIFAIAVVVVVIVDAFAVVTGVAVTFCH